MPNWCEGTLKVRGNKENIKLFIKNGLQSVDFNGKTLDSVNDEGKYILYKETADNHNSFYIIGTRRYFINQGSIIFEWEENNDESILLLNRFRAAWVIEAEQLAKISKEYNIDFKIYGFEQGMEFNQDIEIIKGKIIKDKEIKFDNYNWDCICPKLGG